MPDFPRPGTQTAPSGEADDPQEEPRQQSAPRYASRSAMHGFYALLAVPMDATPEDIKRAYRELARQFHPDMNPAPEATAKMQAINQAYDHIMAQFGE